MSDQPVSDQHLSDPQNESHTSAPEDAFIEAVEQAHDDPTTGASLTAGEKFTPEKLGDAAIKFATETAYAAAGLANVLAEKAKEFYEAQRKELAAKTPDGVDPNFRQFVDSMPEQFKGFIDEVTKAFHEMAERGRVTVTDFQEQVQAAREAAREARQQPKGAFDLDEDAEATADEVDMVAPDTEEPTATSASTDAPAGDPAPEQPTDGDRV